MNISMRTACDSQGRVDVEEELAAKVVAGELAEMDLVEAVKNGRRSVSSMGTPRRGQCTHTTPEGWSIR
jgi:hypothetical protein